MEPNLSIVDIRKFHPTVGDCSTGRLDTHYDNNRFRQAYTMDYEV
eukprot:gene7164-biopygen3462